MVYKVMHPSTVGLHDRQAGRPSIHAAGGATIHSMLLMVILGLL